MSLKWTTESNSSMVEPELVLERFARVAEQYPDSIAVRFGTDELAYSELIERASQLSSHLRALGVGRDSLVGIALDRSLEMIIAIMGTWMSGAAYIPLDPEFPPIRLLQMLDDARPIAILTQRAHEASMSQSGVPCIIFDSGFRPEIDSRCNPEMIQAKDLAYVIYTSGSTGKPKGVEITHGALARFLTAVQEPLQLRKSDVFLAITTLSFDISILEIVLPLTVGATVILADNLERRDGHQIKKLIENEGATFLQATPTTWQLLLDARWSGSKELTIISGGETLPRPLAESLLKRGKRVFNFYGPTEVTIWSTFESVASGEGSVPIGRPLSNCEVHILDQSLKPVGDGETGQLYLGGTSLARGYLNRPEETKSRFVSTTESRLYATGDLVRMGVDKKIEFVGRTDTQIKIGGFRVEPGDIEAQLIQFPPIKEAVVVLREQGQVGAKLVAYCVPKESAVLDTSEIRQFLRTLLPHYLVPHLFVVLGELPKTLNDKIDRNGLPAPEVLWNEKKAVDPAENPLEVCLQTIWMEVLGHPEIGVEDNFFELGGDSIQMARIANRIQDLLDEVVWPVIIYDAPTIKDLAHYLRGTYPDSVREKVMSSVKTIADACSDQIVDQILVEQFESLTKPLQSFEAPLKKNRRAVFILCPPRSGSTLLRVILAGHPKIFAPPEMELLTFNKMSDRAEMFTGREAYRLEGTIRAVMELKKCSVDEARAIIETYEQDGTSVAGFYGVIQSWLEDRILVDKTPSNCLYADALRRAEDYFEDPLYIHLTRHPLGMIHSFMEARISEVFFRRTSHNFSPRELGELVWLTCHNNILAAMETVPDERIFRMGFEQLTREPEGIVQQLCEFLGIDLNPEMLVPNANKNLKMTDGLHSVSKMMGDPKFHTHDKIDAKTGDRWRRHLSESSLGAAACEVAGLLGYDIAGARPGDREEFVF